MSTRRVRYVAFRESVDLPGKSMANNVYQFDPEFTHLGGFDLSFDTELRMVRVAVRTEERKRGVGDWIARDTKQPLHGLGAVTHVPAENIRKIEFWDEYLADVAGNAVKLPAQVVGQPVVQASKKA